ncbi:hypothetical protein NMI26_000740 [Salmonella enterica subsp. enterica serovar Braenderup]|nr:hypothetical protein [Salmonella enterica subsp. enterica serovar Braenderup]
MGVYRWYVIFSLILFSALSYSATRTQIINAIPPSFLISRSAAVERLTDAQCQARPVLHDYNMSNWFQTSDGFFVLYNGCIYQQVSSVGFCAIGQKCLGDWKPLYAYVAPDGGDDTGDTGDSGDSGGGSTEPSHPDITPPVTPPVKPDTSSVGQLWELYLNCSADLSKYPRPNYDDYNPAIDYNYNARAGQCNAIYDRIHSMVGINSMSSPSDANHQFLTKDGSGNLYNCKRNPYTPQEMADMGKLYPGEILGNQIIKAKEREIGYNCRIVDGKNQCTWHLNFDYVVDNGKGTTVCNSVYNSNSGSGDSDSGTAPIQCPSGQILEPNSNKCLDISAIHCNAGYHLVLTGPEAPTCQFDTGSSGGNIDSGDDSGPGLSTPSLDVPELTLSPLWNIWPSARDFKLSLPAAQCPVFNIEVFGTNHKIDTFCTLFTPDIIAIIRAICILTASIISFIIVLRS